MTALATGGSTQFEDQYCRTTPRFETGHRRYAWLQNRVFLSVGRIYNGGVQYRVYPSGLRPSRSPSPGPLLAVSFRSCLTRACVHPRGRTRDARRETLRRGLQVARENEAQGWVKRFKDALAGDPRVTRPTSSANYWLGD
jgi:hypothetical protein